MMSHQILLIESGIAESDVRKNTRESVTQIAKNHNVQTSLIFTGIQFRKYISVLEIRGATTLQN